MHAILYDRFPLKRYETGSEIFPRAVGVRPVSTARGRAYTSNAGEIHERCTLGEWAVNGGTTNSEMRHRIPVKRIVSIIDLN